MSLATLDRSLFAPVRSQTAFEETLERLGTAIKLGLLEPGTRLPAERDLCEQLGIARSTLRQALTALVQSGYLHAVRGRGGGTFVADRPPVSEPPSEDLLATWRDACDQRLAVELGVALLAAERADPAQLGPLRGLIAAISSRSGPSCSGSARSAASWATPSSTASRWSQASRHVANRSSEGGSETGGRSATNVPPPRPRTACR